MRTTPRGAIAATAAAAALLVVGGVAYATIPDATGVIHGCYSTKDGSLRVIDTGALQSCDPRKETTLDWNQTGPAGPQGPPGVLGLQIVTRDVGTVAPGDGIATGVTCPAGKSPLSGGWQPTFNVAGRLDVVESYPNGRVWMFTVFNDGIAGTDVTLYAVCADAS